MKVSSVRLGILRHSLVLMALQREELYGIHIVLFSSQKVPNFIYKFTYKCKYLDAK